MNKIGKFNAYRKKIRGKKGDVFFTLLLCAVILAFVITIYVYSSKESEKYKSMRIGQSQLNIFRTYEKGENLLFFLDESSDIAIKNATDNLANNGGLLPDSQNLIGAPLWYYKGEDLRPHNYRDNFIITYGEELSGHLSYMSYFTNVNFNIDLKQSSPIYLVGIGETSIRLPLDDKLMSDSYETIDYVIPPGAQAQAQKVKSDYYEKIKAAITETGVDVSPEVVMAFIMQESKGDPNAVSQTGCVGIMQICIGSQNPDIITKVTPCKCEGSACTKDETRNCHASNDDRFDVDKSLKSGVWLIGEKMKPFKKYTDKNKFTIAAYNCGAQIVLDAIEKTGKDDPLWDEVSSKITPDIILNRLGSKYFGTIGKQTQKVNEIRNYVPGIYAYYDLFAPKGELDMTSS